MRKVLIAGANSYIGTHVEQWLQKQSNEFHVDTIDTVNGRWKNADFSQYDVVFYVAGIAHVNAKKSMEQLYYQINRDLTIEIANRAKESGVKQFIFMSSMIVFHESRSLESEVIELHTIPRPNGFYGDSKLQAEQGIKALECETFKVAILRPPMIYGPACKGNFMRLVWLAKKTPVFPEFHNERSMLYIDNLCEFVKQVIIKELTGYFYPQNRELADTVEIVKYFANANSHKMLITKSLNIFVHLGSHFIQALNKMFSTYYYDRTLSTYDFEYCVVSQNESFKIIHEYEKSKGR